MNYKILFLIFSLFFINNVSASIFQEDFNTQTSGNFTVISGTPTYLSTFYTYSLYYDPTTNLILRNTTIGVENISYVYYVNTSNNYDFITSFYDITTTQYYEIIFINKTGTLNEYFTDCDDGINGYHSDIQTLNLSNYKDINGWIKIENIINTTNNILKLNDVEIFNSNLGVCNYSKTITEIIINKNYPFYLDNVILLNLSESSPIQLTGTITFKDENINNTIYPLQNALVFINSSYYNYTDSNGEYFINISDDVYPVTISKIGFGTETGNIDTSLSNNDFTLLFSKPSMSLPHIESGNKILSEYSNIQYPTSIWNSPNFVWGVYRFTEFNGTEKDIDYFKPCSFYTGNTFSCELVTNKDYKFRIIFSDLYNYNLNIYHPFLTGNRNFTTGQITIGSDYTEITNIKTISILPQKERESAFKNYFWEAIYVMIVILVLGLIFTSGKKS